MNCKDDVLFRHRSSIARRWMAMSGTVDHELSDAVRALVLERPGSPPSMAEVADALRLSTRTLRRRLKGLNTGFSALVADIRGSLACHYLTDTSWPLDVIAEKVGYSDASNLRQAIKRWVGESPQAYRARIGRVPARATHQDHVAHG
jgi:AraC-like DNA-binding protein